MIVSSLGLGFFAFSIGWQSMIRWIDEHPIGRGGGAIAEGIFKCTLSAGVSTIAAMVITWTLLDGTIFDQVAVLAGASLALPAMMNLL